jgi:hypothetical protein
VNCLISQNEIVPGSPSTLSAVCYGVYVTHLSDGGSVEVSGNRIHGFADASGSVSNRAVGVYCAPATGGTVTAFNNFIYDYSAVQSLKVSGIYLSVGTNLIYHNSILIDDCPTTNEIAGILVFAGNTNEIRNNIIVSQEADAVSFGIYSIGGSIGISDYNDFYGASSQFRVGKAGTTEYTDVAAWRATGFDSNSVSIDPLFTSNSDLHLGTFNPAFDNLGDGSVPVMVDIDSEARNNPPDIGADEFTYILTPDPPQELTVSIAADSIYLHWLPCEGAQHYLIYGGYNLNLVPDSLGLIGTTVDTFFVQPVPAAELKFYIVRATSQ